MIFTRFLPDFNGINKMNEIPARLFGNSFYGKIIEDPANAQEWMKRMQKMFNVVVRNSPWALRFIPDHLKTQEMCDEVVSNNPAVFFLSLTILKQKKCVSRLLKRIHGC